MATRAVQSGWGTPKAQPSLNPTSQLEALGFRPLRRPETELPELPSALSDLSDSDLVSLMAQFNNWAGYAGDLVAQTAISKKRAERALSRIGDGFLIMHKTEKTVAAAKAKTQQEPEYIA